MERLTEKQLHILRQKLCDMKNRCYNPQNKFYKDYGGRGITVCIVTVEYPNNEIVVDYGWFDRNGVCWFVGMQEFRTSNILAWQPLPEPYKECD